MKFKCGPTVKELYKRKEAMENWHDHFAWWPVKIGPGDCRWLETVQRRYMGWHYNQCGEAVDRSYREKPR